MKPDDSVKIWLQCAVAFGLYLGFYANAIDSYQTAIAIAHRIGGAL